MKVHAQLPDGLIAVGLVVNPDFQPGVNSEFITNLYLIDPTTYIGTSIAVLDTNSFLFGGLAVLGTTIYGTNLNDSPDFSSDFYTGSIATDGSTLLLNTQGASPNRHALAANHAENVLYTIENGTLIKIHPDGTTEAIGPTGINPTGMAFNDIGGDLFAMTELGQLYLISTDDGSSMQINIQPLPFVTPAEVSLSYDECVGILYIHESIQGGLYSVDLFNIIMPGPVLFVGFTQVPAIGLTNNGQCVIDTDKDGIPDIIDEDDDNDGVSDTNDSNPLDPDVCIDSDSDTCDDCSVGTDDFGPLADNDPLNDGPDADGDGICDAGETQACDCGNPDAITEGFVFRGKTYIFGTFADDIICGTSEKDIIFAFSGDDCIDSAEGNDKVFAGFGDDIVTLGAGNDRAFGGPGNDDIEGNDGADWVLGGFGEDFCDAEITYACELLP